MTAHAGNIPAPAAARRARWSAERVFHFSFAAALFVAVLLDFAAWLAFAGWAVGLPPS